MHSNNDIMKSGINELTIKCSIYEYIFLLKKLGYIKTNQEAKIIERKLNNLKFVRGYNMPGDAQVNGDTFTYCVEEIEKNVKTKGKYYFDEVVFHEFSHIINDLHDSLYGNGKNYYIADRIFDKLGNFYSHELFEQDDNLLFNQDPYLGILLLDEIIAQTIAQKMVTYKYKNYNNLIYSNGNLYKYSYDHLYKYKKRVVKVELCNPPIMAETELSDYKEFYPFAKKVIEKFGLTIDGFVSRSLKNNFLNNFFNSLSIKDLEKLYIYLCYLGVIYDRHELLYNRKNINDFKTNEAATDPKKVYKVMSKILN